jgi:L-lysine 2,3-aminomutase
MRETHRNKTIPRNLYCDGMGCKRTTFHVLVMMGGRCFCYCVRCSRRKDVIGRARALVSPKRPASAA